MYIILVYMSYLSTYTFISCLGRRIVSWPRQGSENSLEKPKLMVLQHEFPEEFLEFHAIGVVHAKGSLEVSPCPPPNLFKISKPLSPKWTESKIPPRIPSRMEHEMLTNMDGERVKGCPKKRTEIGHQRITRSKAEIQAAQDGPKLVEHLVENLV